MKKILFIALSLTVLFACDNKQKEGHKDENELAEELRPTADKFPVMKFDRSVVDFGKITEGDTVFHTFKFTNTGNIPLVLSAVNASCGCTTPEWTNEPVEPGKSGYIKVKFNSKYKEGKLQKTVTAYANTLPPDNTVSFKVEVLKKPVQ
ncbi:Protein of unknown function [Pseudarcicella hirudinis]|uniref:DUF1573 domain-containing protein n=1 Tax=Pseudarcicella hirudinis TaxID=1079859 RepID=A0A1I5P293_9BACT|nr:DUF1573 domain-containing protein [Pseudarcicella hirudinis]SFP28097.1 Protein of unknown function [Pseudarcicella hirudinis]